MSNSRQIARIVLVPALTLLLLLLLAGCGQSETAVRSTDPTAPPVPAATAEISSNQPPTDEGEGPIVIENGDGPPFYARFGEGEMFGDGEQVTIVFYRPPDCIPPDFNLNQFFHLPGEDGPGAFACAPPTISSLETWANGPEIDPAPLESEMTGLGAVPVWFFSDEDVMAAREDGEVTISELAGLPSRQVGTATTYHELLHPSQTNEQSLVQIQASGTLEEGGDFAVDISYGEPQVEDHVTIDTGE